MKKLGMIALTIAATTPAFAELAPYYQSAREITAVLENEQVENFLNPNAVTNISRTVDEGEVFYKVTDNVCELTLQVKRLPAEDGVFGPANFELEVKSVRCE